MPASKLSSSLEVSGKCNIGPSKDLEDRLKRVEVVNTVFCELLFVAKIVGEGVEAVFSYLGSCAEKLEKCRE